MMSESGLIQIIHVAFSRAQQPAYRPQGNGYMLTSEFVRAGAPPRIRIEHHGPHEMTALVAYIQYLQRHPLFAHIRVSLQFDSSGYGYLLVTLAQRVDVTHQPTIRIE